MANRYWVGALTATTPFPTWNNTTTNWSDTDGGTPGSFVPVAGDDVYIKRDLTLPNSYINVNQDIGNIASFNLEDTNPSSVGIIRLYGSGTAVNPSPWAISTTVTLNIASGQNVLFGGAISGSGGFIKTGAGSFTFNVASGTAVANTFTGAAATGGWGIDLQQGSVFVNHTNNKLGTGPIQMAGGTGVYNGGSGTTLTLQNAFTINGDVTIDGSTAASSLNLTGSVALGAANRTITNSVAPITISGAITGTSGFTKAGAGALTIAPSSGTNSGLTGTVVLDAGSIGIAGNLLSGMTGLEINGGQYYLRNYTSSFTFPAALSGTGGSIQFAGNVTGAGIEFTVGKLGGYSGTLILNASATAGFQSNVITSVDAPSATVRFQATAGAAVTLSNIFYYTGAGATKAIAIEVDSANNTSTATLTASTHALYANGTGALVISGDVTRTNSAGTGTAGMTLTLRGSSAANINNELSGVISNPVSTLGITKADANRWILSANNTYTGTTAITAGTLSAQGVRGTRSPLGAGGASGGAVTTSSTGVLDISSTPYDPVTAPNGTDAANPMIVDKTTRTLTLGSSGNPQITSTTGFNRLDCGTVTLNTDLLVSVEAGAYLKVNNTAAMTGVSRSATKTGAGEFDFGSFANTFSSTSGTVTVSAGTVSFGASVLSGAASPLGQSTAAIVLSGTTLKYNGTGGHSLTRAVSLSGSPSFDASGTGAVTFSPAITHAAGARTITFKGSSTNDNTFTTALTNNGADVVSMTKTEAGKWILSGAPSYTGATAISDGELQFNGQTLSSHSGLTMSGTGKLSNTVLGGTGKTITCSGGTPEIVATTVGNTIAGTTAINAGSLRVTTEQVSGGKPVKVLGDTNVTVSATLQTTVGTNQRGQMRYGGDLTFSAGSTLRIG